MVEMGMGAAHGDGRADALAGRRRKSPALRSPGSPSRVIPPPRIFGIVRVYAVAGPHGRSTRRWR
jgi:hypothetical protein